MTINRWGAIAVAAALFAAGAATTYLWPRGAARQGQPAVPREPTTAQAQAPPAGAGTGVIQIDAASLQRSGIVVETVGSTTVASTLRLPGTVQPNAYRRVTVTPLVSGRVTRMAVELGQAVRRGETIAEIYSPDVAAARARYLAGAAELATGDAKLRRTERLAALGSASQQELEEVRAEHVRHETDVREAAARLRLFGFDPAAIGGAGHGNGDVAGSSLRVVAPDGGVILERPVTVGATVEPSTVLATIASLSPVWVIADAYDRDVAALAQGARATVSAEAYPGQDLEGRVTYISPEVRPETRTTQVRVEVPNPGGRLRFGMFVTVSIAGRAGTPAVSVPRGAVQTIGSATVVFVPDSGAVGTFRERQITVGDSTGDRVTVLSGLSAGEKVVSQGSFALRAEAERLGIRPVASPQLASVRVTAEGFEPKALSLVAGVPARVTFTRTTNETCATEVAVPAYGIRRALPLDEPVAVEFTPRAGETSFQCGMGMLRGTLVVR